MPETKLVFKWKERSSGIIHTARYATLVLTAFRFQQRPEKWRWYIYGLGHFIIKVSPASTLYRTSEEACEAAERWVTGTEPWVSRTADRLTHSRRNNHGTNQDARHFAAHVIKRPRYGKAPVYRIVRGDQRRRQHRSFQTDRAHLPALVWSYGGGTMKIYGFCQKSPYINPGDVQAVAITEDARIVASHISTNGKIRPLRPGHERR